MNDARPGSTVIVRVKLRLPRRAETVALYWPGSYAFGVILTFAAL